MQPLHRSIGEGGHSQREELLSLVLSNEQAVASADLSIATAGSPSTLEQRFHQFNAPLVLLLCTYRDPQTPRTAQILRSVPHHQAHLLGHALVHHLRHVVVRLRPRLQIEHLDEHKIGLVRAQDCTGPRQGLKRQDECVTVVDQGLHVLAHLSNAGGGESQRSEVGSGRRNVVRCFGVVHDLD